MLGDAPCVSHEIKGEHGTYGYTCLFRHHNPLKPASPGPAASYNVPYLFCTINASRCVGKPYFSMKLAADVQLAMDTAIAGREGWEAPEYPRTPK